MIILTDLKHVQDLQSNLRATFDTPQGKEVMNYLEQIGSWYPSIFDSLDTNAVIARDANRRLLGTIKTLLKLDPSVIVQMAKQEETNG